MLRRSLPEPEPEFDLDLVFESAFQRFVDDGGLDTTRVLSEDIERVYRRRGDQPPPKRCKHGLTTVTCSICYFNGLGY